MNNVLLLINRVSKSMTNEHFEEFCERIEDHISKSKYNLFQAFAIELTTYVESRGYTNPNSKGEKIKIEVGQKEKKKGIYIKVREETISFLDSPSSFIISFDQVDTEQKFISILKTLLELSWMNLYTIKELTNFCSKHFGWYDKNRS